jgi:hypothetical protein
MNNTKMTRLNKAITITGGIAVVAILLGAILNAYGAGIKINQITNLSIPLLVISYLFLFYSSK